MATPTASAPAGNPPAAPPAAETGPGPVAVVWCRQVDNEAESPGYTTIPEDFLGRRETLDLIRLVGNLTVNVADTHDYWTPGPPAPLNYYPNLFLYPAFGGRYTCVGRMFLSTEDRPRLGMKTLVLDSSQLLASGEFGASVLRWHATMAGGRSDGRKPPVPDPNLYALLGEGFLFFRGSTEPVVTVAAGEWDAAIEALFDLVRVLPASLLQLGAVLAFPYFLPQPKTNLHEFTEQVPLALSLMRIPASEAMGDRHRKRLQSWESTHVTFRDLTDGIPAPSGKGKDTLPLVLQYVRDHNATRLGPIVQRVDLVELPKLRTILADPERSSGKERRKEMWRIGTAMESAALLLQRSRGRHVPVSVETARRAQEYIKAKLPAGAAPEPGTEALAAPGPESANLPRPATYLSPAAAASGHPSWLTKSADLPPTAPAGREVVPVSVSEDPSLLPEARGAPAAASSPSVPTTPLASGLPAGTLLRPPPPIASGPASSAPAATDGGALAREVEAVLARTLEGKLTQVEDDLLRRLANEIEQAVGTEVDRRVDAAAEAKFRPLLQASETHLAQALTALDTRWQTKLENLSPVGGASAAAEWRTALDGTIDSKIARASEAQQAQYKESLSALTARVAELDLTGRAQTAEASERLERAIDAQANALATKLAETQAAQLKLTDLLRSLDLRLTGSEGAQAALTGAAQAIELRLADEASKRAMLEEAQRALPARLADAESVAREVAELTRSLQARFDELDQRASSATEQLHAIEQRASATSESVQELAEKASVTSTGLHDLDLRTDATFAELRELSRQAAAATDELRELPAKALADVAKTVQSKVAESEMRTGQQMTGLLASTETRLRESMPATLAQEVDRRLQAALERELSEDVNGGRGMLAERIDTRTDELVRLEMSGAREQLARSLDEFEGRMADRLKSFQSSQSPLSARAIESVQPLLERRLGEIIEVQRRAIEELRNQLLQRGEAERAALAATVDQQIQEAFNRSEDGRAQGELRVKEGTQLQLAEAEERRAREAHDLETRLNVLVEARSKEASLKLQAAVKELEARSKVGGDDRFVQLESRVGRTVDGRIAELKEAQAHSDADLQVRLQGYSDQRLRETEERLRSTTVELLARQRSDVEAALARLPDLTQAEALVKERVQRAQETLRSEMALGLDTRVGEAEERLHQANVTALAKLDAIESDARTHGKELLKIEESLRGELEEIDRRLVTLADRLLPVVRKTWLRVAELEKNPSGAPVDLEPRMAQLRREMKDEIRKVDLEMSDRFREIRDRMETTIAHQGKVWLTLIHQLSQLTEQRRASEASAPPPPGAYGAADDEDAVDDEEPEEPPRRRPRRPIR